MQNKINYDVLVIAVIICIIIINIIYIFNNGLVLDSGYMNSFSKKVYKDYSDYITNKSESDKQVINSYFSEGMSLEDYKSIIDRKSIVVNSSGNTILNKNNKNHFNSLKPLSTKKILQLKNDSKKTLLFEEISNQINKNN